MVLNAYRDGIDQTQANHDGVFHATLRGLPDRISDQKRNRRLTFTTKARFLSAGAPGADVSRSSV